MAILLDEVHTGVKSRQRKTHTKSRAGCKNCKLRRVKCDEGHPQCNKCISYGAQCTYGGEGADELHMRGESSFAYASWPNSTGPGLGPDDPKDSMSPEDYDGDVENMLDMPLSLHLTDEVYRVTKGDLDIVRMFRNRTVYTIGTAQSVAMYKEHLVNLCFSSSCLAHVIFTLTLMHDRYLNSAAPWPTEPSQKESFHLYHGTAIFNDLLSHPIREEDKDALWGCAAVLGAITIASVDANKPEEAWPMKYDTLADLDWLRMSDGKKEVWRLVDPLRETSIWKDIMSNEGRKDPEPYHFRAPELDLLYPFLTKIYDFDPWAETPEDEDDPYHTAASILTRLLELDCNHSTIMYFLSFLGHMDPRFRELLHRKDPKALLLLSWWYGKMCQYNVWWQSRRMSLEGQAICLYLEKNHSDQQDIIQLLNYPKVMTGMVSS